MAKTLVWPWKDEDELLEVRGLLYPSAQAKHSTRQEMQQLGVNIVNTWKLRRCRIPHSIQATADLIDATLHHDDGRSSASTIRAVYASAIAKLVTSICDLEQDSVEKRSMMDQAKKINMPEDWVHIRHQITHGQTPGLRTLETTVREAIPWMWDHFWINLSIEDHLSDAEVRRQINEHLITFRRERRAEITAKQEKRRNTTLLADSASKAIHRICRRHSQGLRVFISVLLEDKILLPSHKQASPKFRGLLLIWDALMQQICAREHKFLRMFAMSLARRLQSGSLAKADDTDIVRVEHELITEWLCHVLSSTAWTSSHCPPAIDEIRLAVVETCLLHRSSQTNAVVNKVLDSMSSPEAESLAYVAAAVYDDSAEIAADIDVNISSDSGLETTYNRLHGWSRPVDVWIPKPIGVQ